MRRSRLFGGVACVSIFALSAARAGASPREESVIAAHRRERVEAVATMMRQQGAALPAGVQCCNILQIPAAAFAPWNSSVTWQHSANGYIWAQTLSGDLYQFWAPVTLPTGTQIVYVDLYYYNNTSSNPACVAFSNYTGGGPPNAGPPGDVFFAGVCSPGVPAPGYGVAESGAFSYTVNNDAEYEAAGGQLVVKIELGTNSPDLAFKAVDIWYTQQVSPAPAAPTFNDVPVSDPAFQFIEALAASGITVGCGGGNYCPDAPLTRRQMAVFLAKGLGLYWPY